MAKSILPKVAIFSVFTITAILVATATAGRQEESPIRLPEKKFSKLQFYVHDYVSGPNQSVYDVAESTVTGSSGTWFGRVQVADHLLTVGPEPESERVGRVQGIHVNADLHVAAIGVNWNFHFDDGEGSTVTVVGRLVAFAAEGELSIVGGTGKYLMARGVALKRTLKMDPATYNSVMQYTLYVYSSSPAALGRRRD
ncbi:dirigent protein 21-like [Andrographis paniculata]|uniref:dirigent protein 21-like n=1 Tax=Andrographis paniculata TaxID=175694 RepID=UPI0021E844F4|nr:dirigent protein 21-like [Andrographis paniculata]